MAECTLQRCEKIHEIFLRDLVDLTVPAESQQSLEIVTHSLGEILNVYKNLGPATITFVEVIRKRKRTVMGPNKWEYVK